MHPLSTATADKLATRWLADSIPQIRPGDLVEFSETGFHIAGRCIEGPDAGGWYQVESLVALHHEGGHDDTATHIEPGDRRSVHWGRGLVGLLLELGTDGQVLRAVRPVTAPPPVERVVEIKPSQPVPRSEDAERRRRRAGNTIRKQTSAGTWAPINLGADGERFQRQQLTTKLHPQARQRLDQLAADSGLRACEVLEALLLDRCAATVVGKARPMGAGPVREPQANPGADRTGERRTRLTKAQGEKVNEVLAGLLARGTTSTADLQQVADAASQPLSTIRTRLRRLQQQGAG
jgi:hypothetical protein